MAVQRVKRLQTNLGKIKFDIELKGPIVAVGGDSGTGKTLLFKALNNEMRLGNKELLLINYDTVSLLSEVNESGTSPLESLLEHTRDKLIVMDNADILLSDGVNWKKILVEDDSNQYLLFCRYKEKIGKDQVKSCRFICKDRRITAWYCT
ncbi:MAG: AAA family ATPase [Lachnospiraceae bacterium]|nr:AAA family ATPase [Lachnospiraceae bacterium]